MLQCFVHFFDEWWGSNKISNSVTNYPPFLLFEVWSQFIWPTMPVSRWKSLHCGMNSNLTFTNYSSKVTLETLTYDPVHVISDRSPMWHLFVEAHYKFPSNTALQKRGREINLAERGREASPSPVIIQDMLGRHQGKEKLCNILAKARLWLQITAKPLWSREVQSFPGTQDRPQKTIWQKSSTQNLCRLVFGYHQIVMWRLAAVHIGILAPQKTMLGESKRGGIFYIPSIIFYA